MPVTYLWLFPLGLAIGAFGTLIGAGGGFILVPILLIVYPDEKTELITSISLAVVFFNALSGSFAYARMKRIDFKSGIVFAVATIPGAILGAISVAYVPRQVFDIVFGVIMIAAGAFLWLSAKEDHAHGSAKAAATNSNTSTSKLTFRDFIDADGVRYQYAYNPAIGIVLSVFVGYVSSLLGVGGGFIHVPALSRLLNFPGPRRHRDLPLRARGHGFDGHDRAHRQRRLRARRAAYRDPSRRRLDWRAVGARLSNRIGGKSIIRGLALALVFVGLRLVWSELRPH